MKLLKNYFTVFFLCIFISIFAKLIFAFYSFTDIAMTEKLYAVFYGYKFDFAVGGIIAFLTLFFDFNKKLLLGISLFLILLLFAFLMGDIMYFGDASRHISYEIKDVFAEAQGLLGTTLQKYLGLFIFGLVSFIIFGVVFFKLLNQNLSAIKFTKSYIPVKLLLIAVSVFFVRGMLQSIPLNPSHAYKIANPKLAMLSLNGAYNVIYHNINNKGDIQITPKYKVDNELQSVKLLYTNSQQPTANSQQPTANSQQPTANSQQPTASTNLEKPNVVILFLESWSASFLKDYGAQYDVAPRFGEILAKSIRPKAMMANGHRTVEGIFATLTSFQNPLGKSIARTSLEPADYSSLINLFKKEHYSSAFFQGFYADTLAGTMAQRLGFEKSYGKRSIKNRRYEENHWGVHDPDLYDFVFETTKEMKAPFIIGVNTTTTHDDVVPKGYPIKRFTEDDELNEKLNTFRLSDEATYDFVQKMEKQYPNTVFVFLADHTAGVLEETNFHNYLIPFAIYSPKLKPRYIDEFISQRDIAPTITDLVLGDYHQIAPEFSGKSLLRENNFFADYYHNGVLGVVKDNVAIETVGEQTNCFDVSNFKLKEINCSTNAHKIINQIKAFTNIQQELLFKGKTQQFSQFR